MKNTVNQIHRFLTKNKIIVILITVLSIVSGIYAFFPKSDSLSFKPGNSTEEIINEGSVTNSIQTVGQSGGINTVNVISSSTPSTPIFRFSRPTEYFLLGGKYKIEYDLVPMTEEDNPVLFSIDLDKGTTIKSVRLVGAHRTMGDDRPPLSVSSDGNPNINSWFGAFTNVPPMNFKLEIIFSKKPETYTLNTSAI